VLAPFEEFFDFFEELRFLPERVINFKIKMEAQAVIIYDLRCENGHEFEGWFKDRENWIEQNSKKLVTCPVCNSAKIEIIPSSITIMGKDSKEEAKIQQKELSPVGALRILHQYLDEYFEDVGDKFAEVALKIHHGEEEKRNIKGTSTPEEEETLKEEGVHFIKVPVLKMDS
jgi:hypothetical protein